MTASETTPAPGPGSRVGRTAGQLGGALVLLELWQAFSWFGSGDWSDRQWVAVYAVAAFVLTSAQNLLEAHNGKTEVAPTEPTPPSPEAEPEPEPESDAVPGSTGGEGRAARLGVGGPVPGRPGRIGPP